MIDDCKAGKIDLVITKSVSRFARNAVDCLSVVRELSAMEPKVGVLFETENINTLRQGNETLLTIIAAFAENESRTKSESMLWSLEKRFSNKKFLFPTDSLLGYQKVDGKILIEPEGAKTVRLIYNLYLAGYSSSHIAAILTSMGRPTGKGNLHWSSSSVSNILKNERYCGDIVAQKTYTKDFLKHEVAQNRGQKQIYYLPKHHEGIVTQEEHTKALLLLSSNHNSNRVNASYTLTVVREGLLSGFIPINRGFGGYNAANYIQATQNAEAEEKERVIKIIDFPGCQVVRMEDFNHSKLASLNISRKTLTFNKECITKLPDTEYAEILLHPTEKILAVRPTNENSPNAVKWLRIKKNKVQVNNVACAAFTNILYELMGWPKKWKFKLMALCLNKNDESVLFFDLRNTEFRILIEEFNRQVEERKRNVLKTFHPTEWRSNFGPSYIDHIRCCRWHKAMLFDEWNINAPGLPVDGFKSILNICNSEIQTQINSLSEYKTAA